MPGHDSLGHHNVWKFLGWYILFAAGAGHVFLFLVYCSFSLLRTAGAYKWVPGSYIVPAIVRFFGLQAGVPCQIRKMHTWNRCIFVLFAVFSNNCKWHFVWQLWRKLQRDGCCHSSWRLCIKLSFRLAEGLAAHRMRQREVNFFTISGTKYKYSSVNRRSSSVIGMIIHIPPFNQWP